MPQGQKLQRVRTAKIVRWRNVGTVDLLVNGYSPCWSFPTSLDIIPLKVGKVHAPKKPRTGPANKEEEKGEGANLSNQALGEGDGERESPGGGGEGKRGLSFALAMREPDTEVRGWKSAFKAPSRTTCEPAVHVDALTRQPSPTHCTVVYWVEMNIYRKNHKK